MNTQLDLNNPDTIRTYFEKVRELSKSGIQYPVSLDQVWPLVYSEKGKAVRVLKKEYIENEDYRSFAQNGKREVGGTIVHNYQLSVSCMEHLVARKVKGVFEVYRQVFHKTADAIEQQQTLPLTPMELLVQQMQGMVLIGQQMVNTQRELAEVKIDLQQIKQIQAEANAELAALPAPTEPMAEMSKESKIIRIVNAYAKAKVIPQKDLCI